MILASQYGARLRIAIDYFYKLCDEKGIEAACAHLDWIPVPPHDGYQVHAGFIPARILKKYIVGDININKSPLSDADKLYFLMAYST